MPTHDPWCIDHYTKKYPYCYWADGKELPMQRGKTFIVVTNDVTEVSYK